MTIPTPLTAGTTSFTRDNCTTCRPEQLHPFGGVFFERQDPCHFGVHLDEKVVSRVAVYFNGESAGGADEVLALPDGWMIYHHINPMHWCPGGHVWTGILYGSVEVFVVREVKGLTDRPLYKDLPRKLPGHEAEKKFPGFNFDVEKAYAESDSVLVRYPPHRMINNFSQPHLFTFCQCNHLVDNHKIDKKGAYTGQCTVGLCKCPGPAGTHTMMLNPGQQAMLPEKIVVLKKV